VTTAVVDGRENERKRTENFVARGADAAATVQKMAARLMALRLHLRQTWSPTISRYLFLRLLFAVKMISLLIICHSSLLQVVFFAFRIGCERLLVKYVISVVRFCF
jgi:hypothetical protein